MRAPIYSGTDAQKCNKKEETNKYNQQNISTDELFK